MTIFATLSLTCTLLHFYLIACFPDDPFKRAMRISTLPFDLSCRFTFASRSISLAFCWFTCQPTVKDVARSIFLRTQKDFLTLLEIALRSSVPPPMSASFFTCHVESVKLGAYLAIQFISCFIKYHVFLQCFLGVLLLIFNITVVVIITTSACTPERATPRLVCFWFISLSESVVSWFSLLSFS